MVKSQNYSRENTIKVFYLCKRLAPGGWTETTKGDALTVTRRYLPFWSLSLQGSITVSMDIAYITMAKVSV